MWKLINTYDEKMDCRVYCAMWINDDESRSMKYKNVKLNKVKAFIKKYTVVNGELHRRDNPEFNK